MGSSTTFNAAPIIILRIIYCGLPSARIIAVNAILHMPKGCPRRMMLIYRTAAATTEGDAPKNTTSCLAKMHPNTESSIPTPNRSITAFAKVRSASSCSPLPRCRLMFAAQPSPIKSASAAAMIPMGKVTFVAATPLMPTACPM